MTKLKNSKPTHYKLKIFVFILIFIAYCILLYLPKDFFDEGPSICISILFFDRECYGCGMTRAFQHLIHLDFIEAFNYNKLSMIVFPLTIFLLVNDLIKTIKER